MDMNEPFNRLKACRYGNMLYNKNDIYAGKAYDNYGEWKEGEINLFRQIIQKGHVVLDVGAHIGQHTLFFSQAIGITGEVHAFEPQRICFQTLCANMALNSIFNVFTYHVAVGSISGSINVPVVPPWRPETNFAFLSLGDYQMGEEVPIISIDSLNFSRCHFMKIEVVGMELEVLEGAKHTIGRLQPFLYVGNDIRTYIDKPLVGHVASDVQAKSDASIRFIDSLGYDLYWHTVPMYNPSNYFNNTRNVFDNACSRNMLCIRRGRDHKIEGFPKVAVPD